MKIYIASSRPIGQKCKDWAAKNTPPGSTLVDSMEECDVFVSILYDTLITEEFINSKVRCFNFHPGLLPEYRGAGNFSWVLINGEKETGITLHVMDKGIDHGPIIQRRAFDIPLNATAQDLFEAGEDTIFWMFHTWYAVMAERPLEINATPQDHSKAKIYYRKDLEKAKDLTRFKRAFTFDGKESAYYFDNGEKKYL